MLLNMTHAVRRAARSGQAQTIAGISLTAAQAAAYEWLHKTGIEVDLALPAADGTMQPITLRTQDQLFGAYGPEVELVARGSNDVQATFIGEKKIARLLSVCRVADQEGA